MSEECCRNMIVFCVQNVCDLMGCAVVTQTNYYVCLTLTGYQC